jgi:glucose-6-phosphate 1-dehydrogenase
MTDEQVGQPGTPCVMVIYGASGDLTKRKLIPALYNLAKDTLLPQPFAIVGSARRPMTHETFRARISQDLKAFATSPVDPDLWEWFVKCLS